MQRFASLRRLCVGLVAAGTISRSFAASVGKNVEIESTQPMQEVVVESLAHPEARRYAHLVQGTRIFEQYGQLAPRASLRFRVYPRKAGVNMDNLTLRIVGKSVRIPLQLDSELRFELPIDRTALRENADLIYNRRDGSLGWRPDVRTPGIPANMRRLGDLRLECRVELMGAHVARAFDPLGVISHSDDPCDNPAGTYHFLADRAIFAVTLTYGERRASLSTDKLYGNDINEIMMHFMDWPLLRDRVFVVPLRDLSWPDDTLIEFDYMEDAPAHENTP